ncbi:MAG: DUF2207 domain-containing protein [Patescibacteria group bacterium]
MKWCFFVLISTLIFNISVPKIFAQERSYEYSSINVDIEVKEDSTIRVEEYQKFSFTGTYHQGWREIPLKGISEISDISIFDSKNQKELEYSRGKLNKENPSSWGKYTTFKENGKQIIEWYYNASDEEHEWIIRYTVHGSLQFLKDQTRLYWNIFTDYTVPIRSSIVTVKIPNEIDATQIISTSYRSGGGSAIEIGTNDHIFQFQASNFYTGEAFTIDIGWTPGIPSFGSFVNDFINLRFGYMFSFLIFLIAIIIGFIHWLRGKKKERGRGTIIPEYEPPENTPPIYAEGIMKENISPKGFAATIVSLAVRGYIKIHEERESKMGIFLGILKTKKERIFIIMAILGILFALLFLKDGIFSLGFIIFEFVFVFFFGFIFQALLATKGKLYTLELIKPIDNNLHDFEKKYIKIIFGNGKEFSFQELKKDQEKQQEFSKEMMEIKDDTLKELDVDTKAFLSGGIQKEKYMILSLMGAVFLMIFGTTVGKNIFTSNTPLQLWTIFLSAISASLALWGFLKFEAKLSEKGIEMRQKLLGFKMFLSVTEKDRVKNLTPDMFEKYLPYAMIFGVEKKWAKTFEGMHVPPPEWYGATPVMGAVSGSINTAFSPVSFSNSFSSAFTSAFASTGGAGGAGSGGAGGGGGGGGGGAS